MAIRVIVNLSVLESMQEFPIRLLSIIVRVFGIKCV